MNPVTFNCTVLRDGHQSLAATRMKTADMLPIAPILDSMGFSALETWGGATIDAGLRFLKEWPFDRLDALKKAAPKTPHMMLLRGQNIVGYTNYADDVVEAFVAMSAKHGMNIFRIFDCVNDPRNMETSIRAAKKAGAQAHGTICYTTSPVHTTQTFVDMGRELADMGADAIVIKDMAGLIPPYVTQELVSALKKDLNIPVWIHTHDTAGLGASTYLSAIDAGVDACDVSISPFANGTGQPDCLRMLALLNGNPRKPDYDADKLIEISEMLKPVYESLGKFASHRNEVVDSDTLRYQVPGGMLSNFRTQLKEQGMEDKFEEVFAEIPVVRKALGWIPLDPHLPDRRRAGDAERQVRPLEEHHPPGGGHCPGLLRPHLGSRGPGSAETLRGKDGQGTNHLPSGGPDQARHGRPAQEACGKGAPHGRRTLRHLRHVPAAGGRLLQKAGT